MLTTNVIRPFVLSALLAAALSAQVPPDDPAWAPLDQAYRDLRAREYAKAVAGFREAAAKSSAYPLIYKELAYTLLRIGESEQARDAFEQAVRRDPSDYHVALEYAFLCFETNRRAEALRIFDRVRKEAPEPERQTAAEVFARTDGALAQEIARWQEAARLTPGDFSAHHELARLAEERGDLPLALEHYRESWRIRPDLRSLLIDMGRVYAALNQPERAHACYFAASRAPEPRVADQARDFLPKTPPQATDYEQALAVDPDNFVLRREYAYLLEAAGKPGEARTQFDYLSRQQPKDLLSATQLGLLLLEENRREAATVLLERVIASKDETLSEKARRALGRPRAVAVPLAPTPVPAAEEVSDRQMAFLSYDKGYLEDARRYLEKAWEADPEDYEVALKLGWTLNSLHDDAGAVRWFAIARRSPDTAIASEADRACRSLTHTRNPFESTVWMLPLYSSRWNNLFTYSQAKAEYTLRGTSLRPYVSVRFMGDVRQRLGGPIPQYLSETAFIPAAGIRTSYWKGLLAWGEAGAAISYLHREDGTSRVMGDYRGGLSFAKGFGHRLGAPAGGVFAESNADAVFVSRFDNDAIFYVQQRVGYTPAASPAWQWQVYWNLNVTTDARAQAWANFAETGPGAAFRLRSWPPALRFTVSYLRGVYLRNDGLRRPNFFDLRVGFWYAFSH